MPFKAAHSIEELTRGWQILKLMPGTSDSKIVTTYVPCPIFEDGDGQDRFSWWVDGRPM